MDYLHYKWATCAVGSRWGWGHEQSTLQGWADAGAGGVEGEGWNQTGQNQTQQEIIECILNRLHEKKPNLITFFF